MTDSISATGKGAQAIFDALSKPPTPTPTLTRREVLLAAQLLAKASDSYSNHGCSDFDLEEAGLNPKEAHQIQRDLHTWVGDPLASPPGLGDKYSPDWMLMQYLAEKLQAIADAT